MESFSLIELTEAYRAVHAQVPEHVCLIAVSKMQSIEKIEMLYQMGQRDFGENYAQELLSKAAELQARGCTDIRWHFIGHLQTNKAKQVAPLAFCVHSVDSEKLARALAKSCEESARAEPLPIFIEVNLGNEASKSGVDAFSTLPLAKAIAAIPQLSLQGLMCIPPHDADEAALREIFRALAALELSLGGLSRRKLSMGMSSDLALAISEGSTHVRVGTALFGARS